MPVVVDIETTGLNRHDDRIIEVAIVRMDEAGIVRSSWSTLVRAVRLDKHGIPVDPLTFLHGITAAELLRAPRWENIAHRVAHALDGEIVIGHNVRNFDLPFIQNACAKVGRTFTPAGIIDTLERDRAVRHTTGRHRLQDACAAYGIPLTNAHRALGDSIATAALATRQAALIGWA